MCNVSTPSNSLEASGCVHFVDLARFPQLFGCRGGLSLFNFLGIDN